MNGLTMIRILIRKMWIILNVMRQEHPLAMKPKFILWNVILPIRMFTSVWVLQNRI